MDKEKNSKDLSSFDDPIHIDKAIHKDENVYNLDEFRGCKHMELLNNYFFYTLGHQVHILNNISEETTLTEAFYNCFIADNALESFINDKRLPLPLSKAVAKKLCVHNKSVVKQTRKEGDVDWTQQIGMSGYHIGEVSKEFEHILAAELSQLNAYLVSEKGIFATKSLIERADEVLPSGIRANVSQQALHEIKQAGKCLAFDLPTAVGFINLNKATITTHFYRIFGAHGFSDTMSYEPRSFISHT